MKHILKLVLILFLGFYFTTDIMAQSRRTSVRTKSKTKNVRSASGVSGLKSTSAKTSSVKRNSSTVSATNIQKKTTTSTKSKNSTDTKSSSAKISKEEQCAIDSVSTLLEGDCSFLNEEEIMTKLTQPFLCIYNYKDKSKTDSVYNYFLYQKYGVKDTSLKQNEALVNVKDNPKGASEYYAYLIEHLSDNTLVEGKILDFLTEDILDTDTSLTMNQIIAIESKSVETTALPTEIVKSDLEKCKKATKKVIQECGITSNQDVQDKIAESCTEYEGELVKRTSELKAKVLDLKSQLTEVLKQRVSE